MSSRTFVFSIHSLDQDIRKPSEGKGPGGEGDDGQLKTGILSGRQVESVRWRPKRMDRIEGT
jgi:hypothetical protein